MTTESNMGGAMPPVEPDPFGLPGDAAFSSVEAPDTQWPKTIGIISIIYAVLGMTCQALSATSPYLTEWGMSMQGMEVTFPSGLKILTMVTAIVMLFVGLLLLMGGIGLLKRRPAAIARLKAWAVIRLVLLVVSIAISMFTMPMSIDFQRQIQEQANEKAVEVNRPDLAKEFDEDATWLKGVIMMAVFSGLAAVYPLFIGFYLSRRVIAEEVQQWPQ